MLPLPAPDARLVDATTGEVLAGARLLAALDAVASALDPVAAGAVLCLVTNELAPVVGYLGALRSGRPVIPWDGRPPPAVLADLVGRFAPAAVLGLDRIAPLPTPPGYADGQVAGSGPAWLRRARPVAVPDERLGVLLGTSGSTGQPKLVRLSAAGVLANTEAICSALAIGSGDVAITTLPPHYSYGLSVLHTHLLVGGTVVLQPRSLLDEEFWRSVDRYAVTSLAGVPHTYELLARKPWLPARNPSVRVLTAAGGRVRDELVARFHAAMTGHGGRMYVMYGQTEAGPRICVLPPGSLPEKLGSVGPPLPGIRLSIDGVDGGGDHAIDATGGGGDHADAAGGAGDHADGGPAESGGPAGGPANVGRPAGMGGPAGTGEVVCHSPGVMLGYAESAEDLARGDDLGGTLHTGDLGRLDEDGFLWLSGRMSRIGKAFGVRVNLDAVEHVVAGIAVAAAVAAGDRITIWCEGLDRARVAEVVAAVTGGLGIHRLGMRVEPVDRLPRLPSGKIDYRALPG